MLLFLSIYYIDKCLYNMGRYLFWRKFFYSDIGILLIILFFVYCEFVVDLFFKYYIIEVVIIFFYFFII